MTSSYFVTGTDTGVGKTLATAALLRRLRDAGVSVAGMKPIAPHIAAAESATAIDTARIVAAHERLSAGADIVLAEGAGGFLVPLDPKRSCAELPALLGMEVILVVGLRLGCLNHALLTAEAIAARGLTLAGWIGNSIDPAFARREANLATLESRIPAPCLGIIPWMAKPDVATAAASLSGAARLVRIPLE